MTRLGVDAAEQQRNVPAADSVQAERLRRLGLMPDETEAAPEVQADEPVSQAFVPQRPVFGRRVR